MEICHNSEANDTPTSISWGILCIHGTNQWWGKKGIIWTLCKCGLHFLGSDAVKLMKWFGAGPGCYRRMSMEKRIIIAVSQTPPHTSLLDYWDKDKWNEEGRTYIHPDMKQWPKQSVLQPWKQQTGSTEIDSTRPKNLREQEWGEKTQQYFDFGLTHFKGLLSVLHTSPLRKH